MIAFDIAVVAQKVKVQLLYNGRYAKSEKVGCCWVSSRSGWLLELLTELKIEAVLEIYAVLCLVGGVG